MAQKSGSGLLIIERILRDRDGIWRQVVEERDLKALTVQMVVSSAVGLACYGIVLGASHSFVQAVSSAIKLPLLFLATLAICLPTLYLFNLIFGARLSMMQAVALIMVSITVISVLALAFAPISLFFLISADNYPFFKLLNVAILMLAAFVGLKFLTSGMSTLNAYQAANPPAVEEPAPVVAVSAAPNGGAGEVEPAVAGLVEPGQPGPAADGDPAARTCDRAAAAGGCAGSGPDAAQAGEHDVALHLDRPVRLRRNPARVDPAAVLRQSGRALRSVPQHRRYVLRGRLPYHRASVRRLTPRLLGRAPATTPRVKKVPLLSLVPDSVRSGYGSWRASS